MEKIDDERNRTESVAKREIALSKKEELMKSMERKLAEERSRLANEAKDLDTEQKQLNEKQQEIELKEDEISKQKLYKKKESENAGLLKDLQHSLATVQNQMAADNDFFKLKLKKLEEEIEVLEKSIVAKDKEIARLHIKQNELSIREEEVSNKYNELCKKKDEWRLNELDLMRDKIVFSKKLDKLNNEKMEIAEKKESLVSNTNLANKLKNVIDSAAAQKLELEEAEREIYGLNNKLKYAQAEVSHLESKSKEKIRNYPQLIEKKLLKKTEELNNREANIESKAKDVEDKVRVMCKIEEEWKEKEKEFMKSISKISLELDSLNNEKEQVSKKIDAMNSMEVEWIQKEDELMESIFKLSQELKVLNMKKIDISEKVEMLNLKENELRQKEADLDAKLAVNKQMNSFAGMNGLADALKELHFQTFEGDHTVTELKSEIEKNEVALTALQRYVEKALNYFKTKEEKLSLTEKKLISKAAEVSDEMELIKRKELGMKIEKEREQIEMDKTRHLQKKIYQLISQVPKHDDSIKELKIELDKNCEIIHIVQHAESSKGAEKTIQLEAELNIKEDLLMNLEMEVQQKERCLKELKGLLEKINPMIKKLKIEKDDHIIGKDSMIQSPGEIDLKGLKQRNYQKILSLHEEKEKEIEEIILHPMEFSPKDLVTCKILIPDKATLGLHSSRGGWSSLYKPRRSNPWLSDTIRPGTFKDKASSASVKKSKVKIKVCTRVMGLNRLSVL